MSGLIDIGDSSEGEIITMKSLGKKLIVIKENAIYEVTGFSEKSPIQRRIIDKGINSEIVGRVFITGLILFKKDCIKKIDVNRITLLLIEALSEISVLEFYIQKYLDDEKKEIQDYNNRKIAKANFRLPQILHLETQCKTILQKCDHLEQILMSIISLFYPKEKITKQSHMPKFSEIVEKAYGIQSEFYKVVNRISSFTSVIRELRNGLDHRLDTVQTKNFEKLHNNDILTPTIELNHKKVKLSRVSLYEFLNSLVPNYLSFYEQIFVYLSSVFCDRFDIIAVAKIPEDQKRYKHVNYSYVTKFGNIEDFFDQSF